MSDNADTEVLDETEREPLFSEPSEELVTHAVRELDYAERLVVYKMNPAAGNHASDVYNFPSLINNLFGTRWDRLMLEGSKTSLVWVEPEAIANWLREVIGDVELADAIRAAMVGIDDYKGRLDAITPLFRERVAQYRAVLEHADAG